jgi:hypothetical protein
MKVRSCPDVENWREDLPISETRILATKGTRGDVDAAAGGGGSVVHG